MKLNRPLLVLGGGALLLILVSLGGVALLLLRTGPLAQRLIREAHALEGAAYPRPAHVPSPTPGTFGQAVDPFMAEVIRAHESRPSLSRDEETQCRDASSGTGPLEALPAGCREGLERDRALLRRVLAATHAEAGGLPEGLRILDGPSHPHHQLGPISLVRMARLAALETRLLLASGKVDEAVDTCLDALALSRELGLGGGLLGRMIGVSGHDAAYRPCAAALDAASSARKRRAALQLARLREGLAPFSRSLREESTQFQLAVHAHHFFTAEELHALPPRSVRLAEEGPELWGMMTPSGALLLLRLDWRRDVEALDGLVAAADLPAATRRGAFAAVAARHARYWGPDVLDPGGLFSGNVRVELYQRFAERAERQRLQLTALLALAEVDAARAEQGQWPAALAPATAEDFTLQAPTPGEAHLTPREASLAEFALGFSADVPPSVPAEPGLAREAP